METAVLLLFLAPVAALLLGFFLLKPRRPDLIHWPIHLSCVTVTAASWFLAARVLTGETLDRTLYHWMAAGDFLIEFGVRVDGLSAAVLAMVSLVGALIHFYATEYMEDDEGFGRFFLYFHFFYLSMIGLLVSNNFLQMYLFWEGVGAASFLLIGFWYGKESARRASLKAFLTNRVGDFGFMLAVLLLLAAFGSVRFETVFAELGTADPATLTWVAFLLAWAAAAKSAQFPLHIWLPDAMEGPTPVSALMHAATMVTAGVFLLARSYPLLQAAPAVLPWIAGVGAFTALGAALVAGVKTDLKRILAYSTVSHLGLMMMALGLGSAGAAVFHLVTHGFFKALLFLCAGNVLHTLGKSSAEVSEVGGLRKAMPFTFGAFAAGALSLAGVPPFAGFFSKDAALDAAFHHGGPLLRLAAVVIAFASAYYIFRMLFLTFLGPSPEQKKVAHPHEGGAWMNAPVGLLALGAVAAGAAAGPIRAMLAGALGPAGEIAQTNWASAALGLAAAAAGAAAAGWACLVRPRWDWQWRRAYPDFAHWVDGEFGWQAFVLRAVVGPVAAFAGFVGGRWDKDTWDRSIEETAGLTQDAAEAGSRLSTGLLNDYLWWMLAGTAALAWAAR